jgi:hypothetical protein
MALSQLEAAEALQSIATAESRSATLRRYRGAAPHLILWGVLWALGYGLTQLMPARGAAIWAVIVVVGLAAGTMTMFRKGARPAAWRFAAIWATLIVFCAATFAIMAPVDGRQVAAFIPLVIAASYVIGGIWLGSRFVAAGIAVAVLTLAGFFLLREYFLLWMAVVGGGALLLAGLWLTKA